MVGHMFRDPRFHSFLRDEDIGQRVAELLAATANLLTITIGVPALVDDNYLGRSTTTILAG